MLAATDLHQFQAVSEAVHLLEYEIWALTKDLKHGQVCTRFKICLVIFHPSI